MQLCYVATSPVLILDLSTYTTEACAAVRRVYTVEACAALRVVYTAVYRGLSCTWTCLDKSSLHVLLLLRRLHHRDLIAADGRVYTGEVCTAPGGVYTTAQV